MSKRLSGEVPKTRPAKTKKKVKMRRGKKKQKNNWEYTRVYHKNEKPAPGKNGPG